MAFRSKLGAAIPLLMILLSVSAEAQRRSYIAPDDHTDYFWVADDVTYRQSVLRMIDYYLTKMDETAANPSDTQMRKPNGPHHSCDALPRCQSDRHLERDHPKTLAMSKSGATHSMSGMKRWAR